MNRNSTKCIDDAVTTVSHATPHEQSKTSPDFRARLNQKLRTPLNAIMGFAELLETELANTDNVANVKHILAAARELSNVIDHDLADPKEISTQSESSTDQCDVLYVEDDLVNFALVESILEYRPALKLMRAACGEMGVSLAQAHNPRLILLDLNLPDIHGSEVLQRLREEPTTAEIPVVVISADATPSQIERLLAAGAQNYLTKPLNIQVFLAVVDQVIEGQSVPSL